MVNDECCVRKQPFAVVRCSLDKHKWTGGHVLLRDEDMDFEFACVLFAHECGHAVHCEEFLQDRLEGVPTYLLKEAAANYYVQRWGFSDQLAYSGGKSVVPTSSSAKRLPKSNLTVQKVRWGSVALHLYCEASHALAESPGSVKFSFAHAWIERSRDGGCTRLSPDAAGYFISIEWSRHYHPVVQHK